MIRTATTSKISRGHVRGRHTASTLSITTVEQEGAWVCCDNRWASRAKSKIPAQSLCALGPKRTQNSQQPSNKVMAYLPPDGGKQAARALQAYSCHFITTIYGAVLPPRTQVWNHAATIQLQLRATIIARARPQARSHTGGRNSSGSCGVALKCRRPRTSQAFCPSGNK